jgi:glycosyltransferase involved in cell wall biosynthesis
MKVSVCIPATRSSTIQAAVRSIVKQTYQDWELLVVAQGRETRLIAEAVERALDGRDGRVLIDGGRGPSRARNVAIAASSGDLIAFMDDDCEAAPNWLEVMVDRLEAMPQVGLLTGVVVAPPKLRRGFGGCPSCSPEDVMYDPAVWGHRLPPGFGMIGANMAITRRTAEVVGPFDEYLGNSARFPACEEDDYRWRAVEHGIVMHSLRDAIVHHTYGWRYGVRSLWGHQRTYASGNGGYAAKLTLLRDPSGPAGRKKQGRMVVETLFNLRNPAALPIAIRRYLLYRTAYRACLEGYSVDARYMLREFEA